MQFDTKNEGTWFWFEENNPEAGAVCLRICANEDLKRIERQCSVTKREYKAGNRYEYRKTDPAKHDAMLWDFCIVDWNGVVIDDVAFPCTYKNKQVLMNKSVGFVIRIGEFMDQLTDAETKQEKAEEKNSLTSQDG